MAQVTPASTNLVEVLQFGPYSFNIWRREITLPDRSVRIPQYQAIVFRALGEAKGGFFVYQENTRNLSGLLW